MLANLAKRVSHILVHAIVRMHFDKDISLPDKYFSGLYAVSPDAKGHHAH